MNKYKQIRNRLGFTVTRMSDTLGVPIRMVCQFEDGITPPEWAQRIYNNLVEGDDQWATTGD